MVCQLTTANERNRNGRLLVRNGAWESVAPVNYRCENAGEAKGDPVAGRRVLVVERTVIARATDSARSAQ